MTTFRYATTIDGRTCCAGNNEDFPRCQNCKHLEIDDEVPNPYHRAMSAAPRVAVVHDVDGIPDPYAPQVKR